MSGSMTIACAFHIDRRGKGRQEIQAGEPPRTACERGRVPRVAKLLALAHRFEGLVATERWPITPNWPPSAG